jgi:hypothetical protein
LLKAIHNFNFHPSIHPSSQPAHPVSDFLEEPISTFEKTCIN